MYGEFRCLSPLPVKRVTVKTRILKPRFSKFASIGSYINGVYCEIRLPKFLITFLIFVKKTKQNKKTTCIGWCGCDNALFANLIVPYFTRFTCTHSLICFTTMGVSTIQHCGLKTQPVFWRCYLFVLHAIYCVKFEQIAHSKNKNLYWDFSLK